MGRRNKQISLSVCIRVCVQGEKKGNNSLIKQSFQNGIE